MINRQLKNDILEVFIKQLKEEGGKYSNTNYHNILTTCEFTLRYSVSTSDDDHFKNIVKIFVNSYPNVKDDLKRLGYEYDV